MSESTAQTAEDFTAELIEKTIDKLAVVKSESEDLSIYRVPNKLREVKADAYNPRVVSIGPFHRGYLDLAAMEKHKWLYMLHFLQYTETTQETEKCLKDCTNAIYDLDKQVRRCYAEEIKHVDVTEVMLLDGCFILELFLRYDQHCLNMKLKGKVDPIFNNAWMIPALRQDLALLENQIPFIVLKKLYQIIRPKVVNHYTPPNSVTSLALKFFQPMNNKASVREDRDTDCNHLLDLIHKFYFLSNLEPIVTNYHQVQSGGIGHLSINLTIEMAPQNQIVSTVQTTSLPISRPNMIPASSASNIDKGFSHGASKLLESGVEFRQGSTQDHLLNITFDKGVIEIPPVFTDETTDSLFRNLIAFEQCHLGSSSHQITSYAILMKSLIRSKEDIKLLQKRNILNPSWVGDQYLIDFETILDHVHPTDFCFGKLCEESNAYSKSWFHWQKHKVFWMVQFRRHIRSLCSTYFSSPWSIIAFLAAAAIFGLTATQTHYAIHPR
ncbi:hypothetical protein Pyn_41048 [Prunus yedoensis var. nudiflora]|uniref:Uncharacterized protein n=1 Tax=Prunus yedoensis var. nudiflora TaxID=2094558 RepID=A0A314XKX0_PRUYE|nr:hypothetical protein Pyn_41048 [Prunus yedoensis var. nudiflora]